jgi:nicotinamidase-related amidase
MINTLMLFTATAISTLAPTTSGTTLSLHARFREADNRNPGGFVARNKTLTWDPHKTAIVICDMWDRHWCEGATRRVGELAPVMNEVVKAARKKGVFIIHAPSDTMEYYKDAPQRKAAMAAPAAKAPSDVKSWRSIDPSKEPPLPIDDSDGGCDDEPTCKIYTAWTREHPSIEIAAEDSVSDKGDEVYNLLQLHGIDNVIVMGVHTNMCVLGRPFSIRRLVGVGKNVVLMRDMTDTMYNHRSRPFVNHFRGTELVVEHIEKYWCPSVTSTDITGKPAFRFQASLSASR